MKDADNKSPPQRKIRVFTPEDNHALNTVPESITAGGEPPDTDSGIHLDAVPVKGLKCFLIALAAMIILLAGSGLYDVFKELLASHWALAGVFVVLLVLLLVLGIRLLHDYIFNPGNLRSLEKIQERTDALSENCAMGGTELLLNELREFYAGKPQALGFEQCLHRLKQDYSYYDDTEVIDYIRREFLQPLDKKVPKVISKYTWQVGMGTALSQWTVVDMALVLWRSIRMAEDIAQIYGMAPSLGNRIRILKKVAGNMALVGTSQIIINFVQQSFPRVKIVLSVVQGATAAIYTANIGIAVIALTRPISLAEDEKLRIGAVISAPIIDWLKKSDDSAADSDSRE